jgi:hypothetical protein
MYSESKKSRDQDPFFRLDFVHNPIDEHADDVIALKILPLQVIVNPAAIKNVMEFFLAPMKSLTLVSVLEFFALNISLVNMLCWNRV